MSPAKLQTKSDIQERLRQLYEEGSKHIVCQFWQDKPSTAAKVTVRHPDWSVQTAFGFAKVRYPDVWDADFGKQLCVRKALAKIARELAIG